MKVIGINGSSRKDSNTTILIKYIFKELNKEGVETELVTLYDKKINSCRACFACNSRKNCVYKDDFNDVFNKMMTADGIILGSPVYMANISSSMQALLERAAVVLDMNKETLSIKYKAGASIVSLRRGGGLNAVDAMNHFFLNQQMIIVGSTYWNMVYGQLPGDVETDLEGIENMKNIGQNMAYVLKRLKKSDGNDSKRI